MMIIMYPLSKTEESYLERIYELIDEKGFANVVDIAVAMKVKPPSVTNMLQKLDEHGLVAYKRYRGVTLTKKGEALATTLKYSHDTLRSFFEVLGVNKTIAEEDACEIEHIVHCETIEKLKKFLKFIEETTKSTNWFKNFKYFEKNGNNKKDLKI